MRRRIILSLFALAVLGSVTAGLALAKAGALDPEWQAVRAALGRYDSYDQAAKDGYSVAGEPCVASPDGTMGFHAVNYGILATGVNDPTRPPILVYIGKPNGKLRLVAAEYFTAALVNTPDGPAPWFAAGPPPDGFFTAAPSVLGRTFDGPMPGHNPQMPWHYDLHAWLFETNPAGTFAPFNPALSCG